VNFQEHDDKDRDDQKRVKHTFFKVFSRPADQFAHAARRIEGRRRLEDHTKALAIRTECFDIVGKRLVRTAMALVLGRVFEQIAMKLLDRVFGRSIDSACSKTISMASAYPATACSSRVSKALISILASSRSTSRSESFAPSIRVDEPMPSIVATRAGSRVFESRCRWRYPFFHPIPSNHQDVACPRIYFFPMAIPDIAGVALAMRI
jgi:hypothetical protein